MPLETSLAPLLSALEEAAKYNLNAEILHLLVLELIPYKPSPRHMYIDLIKRILCLIDGWDPAIKIPQLSSLSGVARLLITRIRIPAEATRWGGIKAERHGEEIFISASYMVDDVWTHLLVEVYTAPKIMF